MISKTFKTLDMKFSIEVPETADEFDQLAKRKGACVESAVNNEVYRGVLPQIRSLFLEAVSARTGVERATKEVPGKTRTIKGENGAPDTVEQVVVWAQTESDSLDTILAKSNTTRATHQDLLDGIAAKVKLDPSIPESAPSGPRQVAKKWLDAAQEVINAGAADKVAAKLTEKLGMPVDASLESLGRAIAEDQRRKSVAAEYV